MEVEQERRRMRLNDRDLYSLPLAHVNSIFFLGRYNSTHLHRYVLDEGQGRQALHLIY